MGVFGNSDNDDNVVRKEARTHADTHTCRQAASAFDKSCTKVLKGREREVWVTDAHVDT